MDKPGSKESRIRMQVKKPRCPREAKQRGRNREEAESNSCTIPGVEIAVKRIVERFTKNSRRLLERTFIRYNAYKPTRDSGAETKKRAVVEDGPSRWLGAIAQCNYSGKLYPTGAG